MKLIHLLLIAALGLQAHFGFVVPHAGGRSADFILSEDLKPERYVNVDLIKEAKLFVRDAAGNDTALTLVRDANIFRLEVPGKGDRIIHGTANLGISPNGRGPKPFLLLYYLKTILGNLTGQAATIGGNAVVELVPHGTPGNLKFQLISRGKPLADAEVAVVLPNGQEKRVKTDSTGTTPAFTETGRFAAWARFWEPGTGEHNGKPYEQLRHYAMLVFDAFPKPSNFTTLPEPTSSFGAVTQNGWLYVYGGHISPTHNYSTASVSGKFSRLNLETKQWQSLPSGPALQGMNLAAHNGKVYRVGGMAPRNAPGTKQDIHSIHDVSVFDPTTNTWTNLTPLPQPRSSHDVAIIDNQLIVTGGWLLKGAESTTWSNTTLTLDLSRPDAQWQSVSQPFARRAFITAVHNNKMYVLGGITEAGAVSADVNIFDPKTSTWSKGTPLPGQATTNFAPAAAVLANQLYVSLADGSLIRWNEALNRWVDVAKSAPRLAHRMVADSGRLLIIGGAEKGKNLDLVEEVSLAASN
ncbi:MAG: hypothetical protein FJW36_03375 [Acidobacteria bacterium]|nr:hypothetical protein [Acidobacteriota bacterium]